MVLKQQQTGADRNHRPEIRLHNEEQLFTFAGEILPSLMCFASLQLQERVVCMIYLTATGLHLRLPSGSDRHVWASSSAGSAGFFFFFFV